MRRFLSIVLALTLCSAGAMAQENAPLRHEVRVGVGFLPSDGDNVCDMSGTYYSDYYYLTYGNNNISGDNPGQVIEQSRYYMDGLRSTWAFSAGYFYSVCKWFHVGATLSYHNVNRHKYETLTRRKVGTMHRDYVSVIPTLRFSYLNRKYVRMYSSLGLGYCGAVVSDFGTRRKRMENFTAWDVTFLGISAGGRLFGSAEFGLYTAGFVKFAIGYRF